MMADQVSRVLDRLGRPSGRFASLAIAAVLALWFALPAFSIAYCEGFQPEIVINTEALRLGDLSLGDTAYPFNGRFFLLTRLGTTISVLVLREIAGLTGLDAFRLIGLASLALLLSTLLTFMVRVYRIPVALGLLCCCLFSPLFETAYLPNDNLPSAALGCLGLVLFWTKPTIARTVVMALLLGLAAVLRLDALLVAPAFAILLLTEVDGWRARFVRALIAGLIVIAVPLAVYRLFGLSFIDTFAAVNRALLLWDRPNRPLHNDAITFVHSITIMGGLAWLLGVSAFVRLRRWRDLALATLVPLLYVIAYRSQLVEDRYLLPLSPFVLMTMAEGFRSLLSLPPRWRVAAAGGFALGFCVWIIPPPHLLKHKLIADDEGPRFIVGRAWNPLPTLWWQRQLRAGQKAIAQQVEAVALRPNPVIVTGYWTADRLTTLALLEDGFLLRPDLTKPECRGVAETFVRGPTVLVQIRTHIPFVWHHNQRYTWEQVGVQCLHAADPAARTVTLMHGGLLDEPIPSGDDVHNLFRAGADMRPPLAPQLASMLTGIVITEAPVDDIASALDVAASGPMTAEEMAAVSASHADRAKLLR